MILDWDVELFPPEILAPFTEGFRSSMRSPPIIHDAQSVDSPLSSSRSLSYLDHLPFCLNFFRRTQLHLAAPAGALRKKSILFSSYAVKYLRVETSVSGDIHKTRYRHDTRNTYHGHRS